MLKRSLPFIILIVFPLMALPQLLLRANAMAFDMADYFLPNRFFAGECLRSGIFPWWNPFSGLGIPFYADLQSGAFYPVVWLIGYVWGYDFFTINCEYLLHLIIAGAGMFALMNSITKSASLALIAAISYQLSGIFIGNAQHLTWIVSAAWLPWVVCYWKEFFNAGKVTDVIVAAFVLMMMTTGGYPGFLIILFYIFLIGSITYSIKLIARKEFRVLSKFLLLNFLFAGIYFLITAPYFFSLFNALPYFTRAEALDTGRNYFLAFTPQSSVSFLFPAATLSNTSFFKSDASMINGYMGLLPLILLIKMLFTRNSKMAWQLFFFSILMLVISFGNSFGLWNLLFNYLPLINFIRFPALFRIFAIAGFIVLAGMVMKNLLAYKKSLIASFILVLILTGFIVISFMKLSEAKFPESFSVEEMKLFYQNSTIANNIIIQSFLQLPLAVLLLFLFRKYNRWPHQKISFYLIFIVAFDMAAAAQLNLPMTIASNVSANELNLKLKQQPSGFPISLHSNVSDVASDGDGTFAPSYFNNNIFKKQFAFTSYNPFDLKNRDSLDLFPKAYQLFKHPPAFITNSVQGYPKNISDTSFQLNENAILVSDKMVNNFIRVRNDSLQSSVTINSFDPNHFSFQVKTNEVAFFTLLQNYYPGWQATINGEPAFIYISNYSAMSLEIPSGVSEVTFNYDSGIVKWLLYISIASQAALLLLLIYLKRIKSAQHFF